MIQNALMSAWQQIAVSRICCGNFPVMLQNNVMPVIRQRLLHKIFLDNERNGKAESRQ